MTVEALDVSTTIGTPYSSSFGMAASVIELPQAPMIAGTLSRTISFSAAVAASLGSDLLSSMSSVDLTAEDAALGVDPVARDLGAHPDVVAGGRHRTGQRLDDADLDRIALLGGGGQNEEEGGQHHDRRRPSSHEQLLPSASTALAAKTTR